MDSGDELYVSDGSDPRVNPDTYITIRLNAKDSHSPVSKLPFKITVQDADYKIHVLTVREIQIRKEARKNDDELEGLGALFK